MQAARLFTPNIHHRYESVDSNKFNNGMSRFYQIKVNSLLDTEHDDIDYITKLSEKNINCTKCGSTKKLQLRYRRNQNRSDKRKNCKYLRTLCDHYCESCHTRYNCYKLSSRQQILDRNLSSKTIKPTKSKTKVEKPVQIKIPIAPIQSTRLENSKLPNVTTSAPISQSIPSYKTGQAKSKPKPRPVKLPPSKIKQNSNPQFSSRLRAFTCLLEE